MENLGNRYSYFSFSIGAFFPLDSHPMVYFVICEIHGFPHQYLIAWENGTKPIEMGEPGKLVPKIGTFLPLDTHVVSDRCGILYHMGNAWLFLSIFNSTGKCSKTHPVWSQVVFPQYYCFCLFQNLVIPRKKKEKKP